MYGVTLVADKLIEGCPDTRFFRMVMFLVLVRLILNVVIEEFPSVVSASKL